MTAVATPSTNLPAKIDMAKPVTNVATLKTLLDGCASKIADILPKHLTPERMTKMVLIAANRQPKLLECTAASIAQSLMRASELGLDCSGTLGDGYLVPFKRNFKVGNDWRSVMEAQFITGYRGFINLARRSGSIQAIEARVVYANDKFTVKYGQPNPITHEPKLVGPRGEIVCVYAVAWLAGTDRPQTEVMTLDEIHGIRMRSKTYNAQKKKNDGPWDTDFAEMARKTVVRRIAKYLPLSPEVEKAIQQETEVEGDVTLTASVVSSGAGAIAHHPTDDTRTIDTSEAHDAGVEEPVASQVGEDLAGEGDENVDRTTGEITGGPAEGGTPTEMAEWEKIVANLSERADCDNATALASVNAYTVKLFKGKTIDKLAAKDLKAVASAVVAGDVTVKKN